MAFVQWWVADGYNFAISQSAAANRQLLCLSSAPMDISLQATNLTEHRG